MKKNVFFKWIASVLVVLIAFTSNTGAILASQSDIGSEGSDNQINEFQSDEFEIKKLDENSAVITFNGEKEKVICSMHIKDSPNDYIMTTYDENGALLNEIRQVGDELVQYDSNGKEIVRNKIYPQQVVDNVVTNDNKVMANNDGVNWDSYVHNLQGNTRVDATNTANALSMLVSVLTKALGVSALVSAIINQLSDLAVKAVANYWPNLYYKGWKQYGWSYAYYMVRMDINYYVNGNFTGFVKNVNGMQGVH